MLLMRLFGVFKVDHRVSPSSKRADIVTFAQPLTFSLHLYPHRLFETFDEGTDFYIVTELVEGGELFDRIVSKAHYTEKEARDLIKSLLETLNYMHTVGGECLLLFGVVTVLILVISLFGYCSCSGVMMWFL